MHTIYRKILFFFICLKPANRTWWKRFKSKTGNLSLSSFLTSNMCFCVCSSIQQCYYDNAVNVTQVWVRLGKKQAEVGLGCYPKSIRHLISTHLQTYCDNERELHWKEMTLASTVTLIFLGLQIHENGMPVYLLMSAFISLNNDSYFSMYTCFNVWFIPLIVL